MKIIWVMVAVLLCGVGISQGEEATTKPVDLSNPRAVVVGDTAVLHAVVTDVVLSGDTEAEEFRMPMTQVWVRASSGWRCLAGHAGPRLS